MHSCLGSSAQSDLSGEPGCMPVNIRPSLLPPAITNIFQRDEGADILIMARTDARAGLGLDEALERCREFRKIGADITFLEAPQSEEEMRRYCDEVDGPKLANMLEVSQCSVLNTEPDRHKIVRC